MRYDANEIMDGITEVLAPSLGPKSWPQVLAPSLGLCHGGAGRAGLIAGTPAAMALSAVNKNFA
jgi:hypothetical protein